MAQRFTVKCHCVSDAGRRIFIGSDGAAGGKRREARLRFLVSCFLFPVRRGLCGARQVGGLGWLQLVGELESTAYVCEPLV